MLGATAGRTTLTGEGLQHADGHSLLLASTNPACVAYDPAFAFEIAHIVRGRAAPDVRRRRDAGEDHDVFYYLTVYNEPILAAGASPTTSTSTGCCKGLYRYSPAPEARRAARARRSWPPASRVPWALEAQQHARARSGASTPTSGRRRPGTSCAATRVELRASATCCTPTPSRASPYVTAALAGAPGPVVAVSRLHARGAGPDRAWVPGDYTSLGTDGFGFADTRGARAPATSTSTRSRSWWPSLQQLARRGEVKAEAPREAIERYRLDDVNAAGTGTVGGDA